jgi:hypothetical protein
MSQCNPVQQYDNNVKVCEQWNAMHWPVWLPSFAICKRKI